MYLLVGCNFFSLFTVLDETSAETVSIVVVDVDDAEAFAIEIIFVLLFILAAASNSARRFNGYKDRLVSCCIVASPESIDKRNLDNLFRPIRTISSSSLKSVRSGLLSGALDGVGV